MIIKNMIKNYKNTKEKINHIPETQDELVNFLTDSDAILTDKIIEKCDLSKIDFDRYLKNLVNTYDDKADAIDSITINKNFAIYSYWYLQMTCLYILSKNIFQYKECTEISESERMLLKVFILGRLKGAITDCNTFISKYKNKLYKYDDCVVKWYNEIFLALKLLELHKKEYESSDSVASK